MISNKEKYIWKILMSVTLDVASLDTKFPKKTEIMQKGRNFAIVGSMGGKVTHNQESPRYGQFIGGNWLQGKVSCPKCQGRKVRCYFGYDDLSDINFDIVSGGDIGLAIGTFVVECQDCKKYYLFTASNNISLCFMEEGDLGKKVFAHYGSRE